MKAIPFIETWGRESFKRFLRTPFKEEHVSFFKEIPYGSFSFNESNYSYNNVVVGPLPTNLDEFIIDMKRIGVVLEWKDETLDEFEPQDYLPENEVREYYVSLLEKMEKGHELNDN